MELPKLTKSVKLGENMKSGTLWFDGGTRPRNPGNGGCGAVILIDKIKYKFWKYLGTTITNNQAEYGGLNLGLTKAHELGITNLSVFGDSQLVIYQMDGKYRCHNKRLLPLWLQANKLAKSFDAVEYNWIRRQQNQLADALATKAIGQANSSLTANTGKDETRTLQIMKEDEVKARFFEGMRLFSDGKPQPTKKQQRIQSLGWRYAKKEATDLEMAIESVLEAYAQSN